MRKYILLMIAVALPLAWSGCSDAPSGPAKKPDSIPAAPVDSATGEAGEDKTGGAATASVDA